MNMSFIHLKDMYCEDNEDAILNSLLTYSVLENTPGDNLCSSELMMNTPIHVDEDNLDDFSDCDSAYGDAEGSGKDKTISVLVDMGYDLEDALIAIERCEIKSSVVIVVFAYLAQHVHNLLLYELPDISGYDAAIEELTDFICAAEMAKNADVIEFRAHTQNQTARTDKKRKPFQISERHKRPEKRPPARRVEFSSRKMMIGFGIPDCNSPVCFRKLPEDVVGPPYFYYENVALTPKGVWEDISRFLYDIEPEFVDSIYFSAAARKRGYIHNLPIQNRQPLLPIPPKTIHEALPETKRWWPAWDRRTKLNCLLTCIGSAQLTERIRKRVLSDEPSESDKKFVIEQCKKWNLVWVGKNRVAVLEPEDMEFLLGFPRFHTRGIGRTDRYKSLGNSFQIDTVAYHLSVLKPIYPSGMSILSLFSGIGGAEVALHRLGITLKNVVSVENSPVSRKVFRDWWEETEQKGNLVHVDDVRKVDNLMIDRWIDKFGGFDLVIGGSPCNNLAGGNRRTRDGLEGEHSSLFFEYYRVLDYVRSSMRSRAAST
ncbi:hypothetical protein BVRB_6g148640 [Beta vulgaris subsp. vulgaris]|nr:hypothetical protein BVRB_6g148640 [Beta vulgaris subsp. vulgaris]